MCSDITTSSSAYFRLPCIHQILATSFPLPQHATAGFIRRHVPAVLVVLPHCAQDEPSIVLVIFSKNGFQRLSGLLRVVVRHLGEQMMRHVCVSDVMMQRVEQPAIVPVYRGERSTQPVPLRVSVVRQFGVSVLEQGDGHQPKVDNQVRHDIRLHQPGPSEGAACLRQAPQHGDQGGVAHCNLHALALGENRGPGVEMVDPGVPRIGPGRGVEEEVQRPPNGEGAHKADEADDAYLVHFEALADLFPHLGDEDLILGDGASVGVVAPVGVLPRVVRDQQEGVEQQANTVVDGLRLRKSLCVGKTKWHEWETEAVGSCASGCKELSNQTQRVCPRGSGRRTVLLPGVRTRGR